VRQVVHEQQASPCCAQSWTPAACSRIAPAQAHNGGMSIASARRSSRDSERRRRALGKAETPEHQRARYHANPEPQKAAMRAYYAANRDQILADRALGYQASREAICARKREAYALRKRAADLAAALSELVGRARLAARPRPCSPLTPAGGHEFPLGWQRESPSAVNLCLRYCLAAEACAKWSLTLDDDTPGVFGGMTRAERLARKRELGRPG
jgi:Transcription factor WhiB